MADLIYSRRTWEAIAKAVHGGGTVVSTYEESHSVIRIPVAGPAPYNTLVVVRGFAPLGPPWKSPGGSKIVRFHFLVRSNFVLQGGGDQRISPVYMHSTAAALSDIWCSTDSAFTYAVDNVDGKFAEDGRWMIVLDTAAQGSDPSAPWESAPGMAGWFHFSSWILCWEEGIDPRNPGRSGLDPIRQPDD